MHQCVTASQNVISQSKQDLTIYQPEECATLSKWCIKNRFGWSKGKYKDLLTNRTGRCILVPSKESRLSLCWSLLMLLATQSQSPSLTSMKQQPNGEYIFHFVFLVCFCSMWFVAGVGQVYFILSLFNSVPTNNYSFTIESENWWKSVITAIYNRQNFSLTWTKPI